MEAATGKQTDDSCCGLPYGPYTETVLTAAYRGKDGDEVQDYGFKFTNQRRRSNSSTKVLNDFKTKFETIEQDPDYIEDVHGPLHEDPDDMSIEKADSLDSGSTLAGSVDEEELKK